MSAASIMLLAATSNRFSVGVSNTSVNGSGRQTTLTTGPVTATPNGGESPYAPNWTLTDSDDHSWSINSPHSFTTTFTASDVGAGETAIATFVCTVADSIGDPAAVSTPVTAYAQNTL